MPPPATSTREKHHRCPGAILRSGVWLSSCRSLRACDGPALRCARGITVSHAGLQQGWEKVGQQDAHHLRHRRPRALSPITEPRKVATRTWLIFRLFARVGEEAESPTREGWPPCRPWTVCGTVVRGALPAAEARHDAPAAMVPFSESEVHDGTV